LKASGDDPSTIFIIVSGQLSVYEASELNDLILLDRYGPGETVGDPVLNYNAGTSTQVVAS